MKSICLLTCLVMQLVMTSAGNKGRYNTRLHEYPDIFLLLDENDVLDEMLDQAWMEVNGSGDEEENNRKTEEYETSGKSAVSGRIAEQSGEEELYDRTLEASGETESGSGGDVVSGDNQKHHQARKRPVQQMDTGCGCEGETCECCLDVDITNNSADAVNPPSICFSIPFVRLLKGCIRFTDISYDHKKFGGCIWLGLKLLSLRKDLQVGCFYTPNATSLGPKQAKHGITDPNKPQRRPRKRILDHSRMNNTTTYTKHSNDFTKENN